MAQDRQETTGSPVNCPIWATQSEVKIQSLTVKLPKAKTGPCWDGIFLICHTGKSSNKSLLWAWVSCEPECTGRRFRAITKSHFNLQRFRFFQLRLKLVPRRQTFPHPNMSTAVEMWLSVKHSVPAKMFTGPINAAEQDPESLQVHILACMKSCPFPQHTFRNGRIFPLSHC